MEGQSYGGREIEFDMDSIMEFLDYWLDDSEQDRRLPNGRDIRNAV